MFKKVIKKYLDLPSEPDPVLPDQYHILPPSFIEICSAVLGNLADKQTKIESKQTGVKL